MVVQGWQLHHLAALHHLAHLGVVLAQLLLQLRLPNQDDGQQLLEAILQLIKALQVLEGRNGQRVCFFNDQHMPLAHLGAGLQDVVHLRGAVLQRHAQGCAGRNRTNHRPGNVRRHQRLAPAVAVFHADHIGLNHRHALARGVDPVDQVLAQRGLAAARLGHHRQHAPVQSRVAQGGSHVANVVRDENVRILVQLIHKRIAQHPEVLPGGR